MAEKMKWRDRRALQEQLAEGHPEITIEQIESLIEQSDAGELAVVRLESLERAVREQLKHYPIDITTDDDDEPIYKMVPVYLEG